MVGGGEGEEVKNTEAHIIVRGECTDKIERVEKKKKSKGKGQATKRHGKFWDKRQSVGLVGQWDGGWIDGTRVLHPFELFILSRIFAIPCTHAHTPVLFVSSFN